jgi:DNA-binding transcriptional MerR regulator
MPAFTIGTLAREAGVKVPTIRFYEQIGLLPVAERSASDRRVYGEPAIQRLAFIKHARQLGFPVDAIRVLLDLAAHPEQPCQDANALAAAQLADVDDKITRLSALRGELQRMVAANCEGKIGDCRVIEVLSDHALCTDHLEATDSSH